jgi:hypothetical protein
VVQAARAAPRPEQILRCAQNDRWEGRAQFVMAARQRANKDAALKSAAVQAARAAPRPEQILRCAQNDRWEGTDTICDGRSPTGKPRCRAEGRGGTAGEGADGSALI